jgi:ABC-2 type transport system ATP-binding protein
MHSGRIRAIGSPQQLKADLGPDATLDDVFRHHTGNALATPAGERLSDVRRSRRTAGRLG